MSRAMIWMSRQNGRGAIDLFNQKHADQLMRQRQCTESDQTIGALAYALVKAVGPADRKSQRGCTGIPNFGDLAGKIFAGETGAFFVERPKRTAFRQQRRDAQRFIDFAISGPARAAFSGFTNF